MGYPYPNCCLCAFLCALFWLSGPLGNLGINKVAMEQNSRRRDLCLGFRGLGFRTHTWLFGSFGDLIACTIYDKLWSSCQICPCPKVTHIHTWACLMACP